ncbi:MAG: GntR family transcriptional regulator [Alphaproteobacteria bacterium]|nr:MAG: GntR family transcriptional regulator [Alphaproteobacteria bacterium]
MLLRDNVYESLRSDILTCRFAPGDDMREQELAERYRSAASRCVRRCCGSSASTSSRCSRGRAIASIRSRLPMRATCCVSALRSSPPASLRRSGTPMTMY